MLQLKGTTQEKSRLKDGVSLSYAFDRTTLNLWNSSFYLVLVAIADLVDSRDPLEANVYFEFVTPQLNLLLEGMQGDQKTLVLRVPRANRVHRHLDILPTIVAYVAEMRDVQRRMRDKRLGSGEATDVSSPIAAHRQRSTVLDLPVESSIESILRDAGEIQLLAALTSLRSGNARRALALLAESESHSATSQTSLGACAYIRAKALSFLGDEGDVDSLLRQAQEALPNNDDIAAAVAQRTLDGIALGSSGREERRMLAFSLEGMDGPSVRTVKAKILALEGRHAAARELLDRLPAPKMAINGLILSIVEGDWNRVISDAATARSIHGLSPVDLFVIQILEARALFQLAMGPMAWPEDGDLIVPATGLPGMDVDVLKRTYEVALEAMLLAQSFDWPTTTQHLLDVFPICAMVLERTEEALPLIASLGRHRASDPAVREAVTKFALNADQPALALQIYDIANKGGSYPDEDALIAVAACRIGNVARAFNIIASDDRRPPYSENYLSALMTVGIEADAALRRELLVDIRKKLTETADARNRLAILDSAIDVRRSILRRSTAVGKLFQYWNENGRPALISRHLLINSDPTDEAEAEMLCEVAQHLQLENAFDAEQWATYAQALLTKENYEQAIQELESASRRFGQEPRITSLLAIALDLDGQAPRAFSLFEELIESGEASDIAQRYFINSAARIGYIDKAIEQVQSVLARTTDKNGRMRHLNTLFQLSLLSDAPPEDLWELAWEYGALSDESNERTEATFVREALVALGSYQPATEDARLAEFERRRDAFLSNFPDSSLLRRFELPENGAPAAVLAALQKAVGLSTDEVAKKAAIERSVDSGALAVPFSWRPRHVLLTVPDLFALWRFRSKMPFDRRAWHFDSTIPQYRRNVPADLSGWEPVLSITSLLVLHECGLLERVMSSFDSVVVARTTLVALQNAQSPVSAGFGREMAAQVMSVLRANFHKIQHPRSPSKLEYDDARGWHEEDRAAMSVPGRFYFCDDVLETIAVCDRSGEPGQQLSSACTVDYLRWADRRSIIEPDEIARHLAQLVRLKIGIEVDSRYLVAAIPESLQVARTAAELERSLQDAEALDTLLGGIWNDTKPLKDLIEHLATTTAYLLTTGRASDMVVEFFWARWLQAVRLKDDGNLAPLAKLAAAFIATVGRLPEPVGTERLWSVYWRSVEVGLPSVIESSPDRTGVEAVAKALGDASVDDIGLKVSEVSARARRGLGESTAIHDLYESTYLTAAAQRARQPPKGR